MQYSLGQTGRIFIIRLEDGDKIPACLERFAEKKKVTHGLVILVGGVHQGEVVVGPRRTGQMPPEPMRLPLDGVHEVTATGILAPGPEGRPVLHLHGALGRSGQTITGCLRPGVKTWLVGEAILLEITGARAARKTDKASGFALLEMGRGRA